MLFFTSIYFGEDNLRFPLVLAFHVGSRSESTITVHMEAVSGVLTSMGIRGELR